MKDLRGLTIIPWLLLLYVLLLLACAASSLFEAAM